MRAIKDVVTQTYIYCLKTIEQCTYLTQKFAKMKNKTNLRIA